MKEIEFSRWLFQLPANENSQFSPSGSTLLPCLSLPSKRHRENSISSIFLESPHQVDMKNVVKSSKHFFGYFNTLETQCVKTEWASLLSALEVCYLQKWCTCNQGHIYDVWLVGKKNVFMVQKQVITAGNSEKNESLQAS